MQMASSILQRIRMDGAQYQDFAILYRTNAQSRALEEQLRRRNIPYMIYSGNSFFERLEVKDMMAYFKLAVNPNDDESFRRVINKPARGIGATSFNALADEARAAGISLFAAALSSPNAKIHAFCEMIDKARTSSTDAYDLAMTLAQESGLYLFYKSDTSVEGQSRFANVQELLDSVKLFIEDTEEMGDMGDMGDMVDTFPSAEKKADAPGNVPTISTSASKKTLGDYLENVSLLSNADVSDEDSANKVALMTVHTAKGLEFPYVYVAGMEENLFPSGGWMLTPQDLEEERRLFYVAITRAKRVVTLSFAQTRMRNGKHESNSPSRFLREIAPQYLDKPLTREDVMSGADRASDDDDSYGFTWRRPSFRDGRSGPAMTERRPVSVTPRPVASRPVTPGTDRASKPPVIDANFVPDPMSSFHVGDRIEHNRFGEGKVLEITGVIPELKARVLFDKYGEKLLLLKFAKIRHK